MASGDTLCVFHPYDMVSGALSAGASEAAVIVYRNGQPVLAFDDDLDRRAQFSGILPRWYAGGGITITFWVISESATTGNISFRTEIERRNTDSDSDSFATGVDTVGVAVSGTSGIPVTCSQAHTSGASMDSLAAGEPFRLRVTRFPLNVQDTLIDTAQVLAIEIRET